MKYKTSELTGALLDAAVAKIEGKVLHKDTFDFGSCWIVANGVVPFEPSTDWSVAGPLIERERIDIDQHYCGTIAAHHKFSTCTGSSPLVAAMRAYVDSKLGDEVDLP